MPSGSGNPNIPNVAGFIRDLIGSDVNATQGLALFRESGGAVNTQRWYSLYGQVADSIARTPEMGAINPYALPSPAEYGTWAMGPGGQYATTVEIQLLDRGTGLYTTQLASYITNEPHTGVDAEQWAQDQFGTFDAQADYGVTVMGATATHYYQTVAYGTP